MKTQTLSCRNICFIISAFLVLGIIGCEKDDPDNTKTPLWVYKTDGDPYQSKPCVAGDKVIVCTLPLKNDTISNPGTYCINRNTGNLIWKREDSITGCIISPVVYKELVIKGGMYPHALNLNNGDLFWRYENDWFALKYVFAGNPLLVDDAVYFSSNLSVTKHVASSGAKVWENKEGGFYSNLRLSKLVFKNGKLYLGDVKSNMNSFFESSGQIDWFKKFEAPFANMPAVTDNEIYIGIQDSDITNKTLRCLNLADQSEKWAVKLGVIFSDIVVADNKVYAIGMQTLHCRSAVDGSAIWNYQMSAGAVSEPLVTGNKVFVGYGNGLLCLNATTGELIWEYNTKSGSGNGNGFTSPTLDGDRIYVSCSDGNIYCFSVD